MAQVRYLLRETPITIEDDILTFVYLLYKP